MLLLSRHSFHSAGNAILPVFLGIFLLSISLSLAAKSAERSHVKRMQDRVALSWAFSHDAQSCEVILHDFSVCGGSSSKSDYQYKQLNMNEFLGMLHLTLFSLCLQHKLIWLVLRFNVFFC